MTVDALLAEANSLGILGHVRAIDVHCPSCGARLHANGECHDCGLVGSSEAELRGLDSAVATALLQRSIARRRAWTPAKKAAKSQER